ncbi:hypothetical protein EW026_g4265 [Hermanssonia centrifuga]|uniref:Uncharacterized protein n=1 Tax=Hermanssonia centrifuga TaxID=98765 RepID=A0A4S4KM86_9APHY|nr:hypothetical protein EW026_g4265 [Hermanssonia centrifuga]
MDQLSQLAKVEVPSLPKIQRTGADLIPKFLGHVHTQDGVHRLHDFSQYAQRNVPAQDHPPPPVANFLHVAVGDTSSNDNDSVEVSVDDPELLLDVRDEDSWTDEENEDEDEDPNVQFLVVCRVANSTAGELRLVSPVRRVTCKSFVENSEKALRWSFFSSKRGQEAFPVLALEPSVIKDSIDGGKCMPTPMLSVTGLALKDLDSHIEKTNAHLPINSQLQVSLHNGAKAFVVTGFARALYGLVTSLSKVRAPSGVDQSKIPFSQRKLVFSVRFLMVNVPHHSHYLQGATERLFQEHLGGEESWTVKDLAIPVYHTEAGADLRELTTSLTKALCDQIFTMHIHWAKATEFPDAAPHAVDFGPGGLSGIGPLTARNLDGCGVHVIVVGDRSRGIAELFDAQSIKREEWWSKKYSPSLVKTSDGTLHIDTLFSRLLGKPPIMIAGMTPSTAKAGYHVELASGGHYNAAALRAKLAEIQSQIPAGVGITLNALYINPRQFGFQFPLWQEMRREGLPIEGFCVAAGIASTEKAAEIIEALSNAGIKHISFKPGSIDGIRQVVNIAASNPDFPVILQWTGGRAGGNHSCEDFHQPILATYSSICQQRNISLVGGSSFGGADDVWPYLTGDFSVDLYGAQPMPFDGFLFASRVMVAKEAHTSSKETGGILTVRSELGEPIHKIATRGVKLWKEFDDTVFKLPKEKRAAWLKERKAEVIAKLNKDFNKPWFGSKKDGSVVEDLADMTYEDFVLRMVCLMYVAHQERWVDLSLRNLTGDGLRRIEERFAGVNGGPKASILQSYTSLDKPHAFIEEFFEAYPLGDESIVAALGLRHEVKENKIIYTIGNSVPEPSVWLKTLAGPRLDWLRALLVTPTIVQGAAHIDNPLRRLFAPRKKRVVIDTEDGQRVSVSFFGAARSYGDHKPNFKAIETKYNAASRLIDVTVFENRHDVSVPLQFQFEYKPSMGFAPIHEIAANRNKRIKEFHHTHYDHQALNLPFPATRISNRSMVSPIYKSSWTLYLSTLSCSSPSHTPALPLKSPSTENGQSATLPYTIGALTAAQLASLHTNYLTTHAADSAIFAFLHGFQGENVQRVPPSMRHDSGTQWEKDLTLGLYRGGDSGLSLRRMENRWTKAGKTRGVG